jgi:large subunit ribosomal protein L24e
METRYCSFCGSKIEFGTGKMFIKRDGSVLFFDSSKCEKNFLKLHREPRRTQWTAQGRDEKALRLKFSKNIPKKPKVPEAMEKKGEDKVVAEPAKKS